MIVRIWHSRARGEGQCSTPKAPEDIKDDNFITDYKPEASDPSIEPKAQVEKFESNAEYTAIMLPQDWTLESHMMHQDIFKRIQGVQAVQGPKIMASWLQEMY